LPSIPLLPPNPWHPPDGYEFCRAIGFDIAAGLFTPLLVVGMNGVFGSVGLWAFGAEALLALAMVGGALVFVRYAGTIIAMPIRSLASLPQGPAFARSMLLQSLALRALLKTISSRALS
jgi:predicted PurR-regulated permease PerM